PRNTRSRRRFGGMAPRCTKEQTGRSQTLMDGGYDGGSIPSAVGHQPDFQRRQ
ncbi:unnamed protein product, partial [Ectocarpus sp. 12 AP-2014]